MWAKEVGKGKYSDRGSKYNVIPRGEAPRDDIIFYSRGLSIFPTLPPWLTVLTFLLSKKQLRDSIVTT